MFCRKELRQRGEWIPLLLHSQPAARARLEPGSFNFPSYACLLKHGIVSNSVGREGPREGSEQRSEDPSTGNFSLASGHGRGGFEVIRSRPETPNVLHLPFCMFSL